MTPAERRATAALAGIFSTRLFGLFLILPVFTLYADTLHGYTPFLAGLALGMYGLSQACLQLPFGMASDRFGRKPVIVVGLLIFAIGSAVAALSDSMLGVIIGRALQGAGAIGAAVIALVADLTRESQRTKAMAIVGITVGTSFLASILLGPVLGHTIGVPGIFWLTAVLAIIGLIILWLAVPSVDEPRIKAPPLGRQSLAVLRDPRLLRLNIGIFVLHAALTATFVVVPTALVRLAGLPLDQHGKLYLPLMVISAVFLFPLINLSERRGWFTPIFAGAVFLLGVAHLVFYFDHRSLFGIGAGLLLFFTGFNLLEATLPSLISKTAPPAAKGTAIGFYSTFQFLGAFVGGALGGWLHGHYGIGAVFLGTFAIIAIWLLLVAQEKPPIAAD